MMQINWAKVIQDVEKAGKERKDNGRLENIDSEINFLCGAMAVMNAIQGDLRMVPPSWIMVAIKGESVF